MKTWHAEKQRMKTSALAAPTPIDEPRSARGSVSSMYNLGPLFQESASEREARLSHVPIIKSNSPEPTPDLIPSMPKMVSKIPTIIEERSSPQLSQTAPIGSIHRSPSPLSRTNAISEAPESHSREASASPLPRRASQAQGVGSSSRYDKKRFTMVQEQIISSPSSDTAHDRVPKTKAGWWKKKVGML